MFEVIYDSSEGPIVEGLDEAPMEALIPLAEQGVEEAKEVIYKRLGFTPESLDEEVKKQVMEEIRKGKSSTEEVE